MNNTLVQDREPVVSSSTGLIQGSYCYLNNRNRQTFGFFGHCFTSIWSMSCTQGMGRPSAGADPENRSWWGNKFRGYMCHAHGPVRMAYKAMLIIFYGRRVLRRAKIYPDKKKSWQSSFFLFFSSDILKSWEVFLTKSVGFLLKYFQNLRKIN